MYQYSNTAKLNDVQGQESYPPPSPPYYDPAASAYATGSPSAYPPARPAYPPVGPYSPYGPVAASPQQDQGRGLALAGFILSILSVVALVGIFAGAGGTGEFLIWVSGAAFAIVGIILSALGRRSVSRKGLAIAGLILSILTLVLLVAILTIGIIIVTSHPA